jgi:hemoglobin/transferrin/lactoferrin receptor protein
MMSRIRNKVYGMAGMGVLAGAFMVLASTAARADDAQEFLDRAEQFKSREVVVTATRTERELQEVASSIAVVSEEDIKKAEATTIADLLQDMPGVEVFDQSVPGAKRIQVRGESGSRVLVLIDGQKISEQKSMDGSALLIDPNRIERIEVIKGPASVLYGSEAIGGVINIITKKGGMKPVQAELSSTYDSSADGVIGYASVFGGHKGLSYRLSGSWTDYGDRRTPDGTLDSSSYDIQEYSAFLGYDRGRFSIGATYDKYKSDVNSSTPDGILDDTIKYFQLDLPRWDREKAGAYVEVRDLAESLPRIRVDVYHQNTKKLFKNDMDLNISMGFLGDVIIQNRITSYNDQDTTGGNFQVDWVPHPDHYIIFGYEPVVDSLDTYTNLLQNVLLPPPFGTQTTDTTFRYDAEMRTHALYLQDEWSLPYDLTATLGVRQTWVSSELKRTNDPDLDKGTTDDSHPVFSAGLVYSGFDNLSLRTLFSQGYRFPNLQQLFIGTMHGGHEPTFANPDLKPEKSNNFEVGARYAGAALNADVAVFFSDAEDYITTAPVIGGRQFANVDTAETFGAELSLSYLFSDIGLTPYASATWIKRKFEGDEFSTRDTGHPPLWGRTGLRYERSFAQNIDFFSDVYARWALKAREEFADGTRESYGSWVTLNLMLGARFGRERQYFATLNLNNILDRSYIPAQSMLVQPGFHAVIKTGITF